MSKENETITRAAGGELRKQPQPLYARIQYDGGDSARIVIDAHLAEEANVLQQFLPDIQRDLEFILMQEGADITEITWDGYQSGDRDIPVDHFIIIRCNNSNYKLRPTIDFYLYQVTGVIKDRRQHNCYRSDDGEVMNSWCVRGGKSNPESGESYGGIYIVENSDNDARVYTIHLTFTMDTPTHSQVTYSEKLMDLDDKRTAVDISYKLRPPTSPVLLPVSIS